MQVRPPCVVSLTWRLEDTRGDLIDTLPAPAEFYYGGKDLLTKVEEALLDQAPGFETRLHLEPEHAFGDYDPALVFFEPLSALPSPIEVGMQFDGLPPGATTEGMPADAIYTVTESYPEHAVLDGNHPLAGMALRLALKLHDVRPATAAEVEAGSVDEPVFTVMNTLQRPGLLH